jgi:hypothetical protein
VLEVEGSAGWLLIFGRREESVSGVARKRNRAKEYKSLVLMDAIVGGCVS